MLTDTLSEVYVSMSRNKLRISLTGFSIAWGIFMLIVLLGAGNGLLHGMQKIFESQTINSVELYPGYTSMSYEGLPKYRNIYLTQNDLAFIGQHFASNINEMQPVYNTSVRASYGRQYLSSSLMGVYPTYVTGSGYKITQGRNINDMDIRERRKVCILNEEDADKLLGNKDESVIGQWIDLYNLPFRVIGLYKTSQGQRESPIISPISTIGAIYAPSGRYSEIRLLVRNLDTPEQNEAFNDSIRTMIARNRQFAKEDRRALWIWNAYEDFLQTMSIMDGLRFFIWLIGIATLIAGVTGISNIMLITVRERTHEFGIRKALGARPRQIVSLVLMESVAITIVFGYVGLFFGIGLTQLADLILDQMTTQTSETPAIFADPTVDLGIITAATLVMVVAGVIAGYIPAKRAVSIKPVEALAAS